MDGFTSAFGRIFVWAGVVVPRALLPSPGSRAPVPFDAGTFGYGAKVNDGAPYTPFLTSEAGNVMAGVYQHPGTGDPQAGVSELALNFDYNASQIQWLLLAPGLINWLTQDTGFWGYNIYRQDPGSSGYGLVGQVAEDPSATSSTTYSLTDHGPA